MVVDEKLQNIIVDIVKKMSIDDFDEADLPARVIKVEDAKERADPPEIKRRFYLDNGWQVCEITSWKVDNNGLPIIQYSYSIEGMPTKYRPKVTYIKNDR